MKGFPKRVDPPPYKRVWILGAGSSISHSNGIFPDTAGFFSAAKKMNLHETAGGKEIARYVNQVIGADVWSDREPVNIEDIFTHLEVDIERSSRSELLVVRQSFLDLIQDLLELLGENVLKHGEYYDLLSRVDKTDTLITYNWDLLLDNALNREKILLTYYEENAFGGLGQYANFVLNQSAISEQTFRHSTLEPPYNRWRPDAGFYLKLHGSIDWFYCQNTACRAFGSVFPWLDLRESACCAECHERLDVLIVPPVLNKDYRKHAFVRRVWNVAALEIATASMLIVWGYSLPPTDFHSMWLFRQARKALLQNLVLINPLVDDPNYVLRFREIFRGKDAKISLYKSYEDFAKAHPVEKA